MAINGFSPILSEYLVISLLNDSMLFYPHNEAIYQLYRIRSLFGGDFNLAVWQFFVLLPYLNNANIVS